MDALEVRVHRSGSIFGVIAGGNYEASLLLLDELWDSGLRQFVTGTYAAVVPARDILAFADASDSAALSQLREVVARVWPDGDHRLSQRLFTRADGVWKLFEN